jgi:very-short-patch-repair endonuclease
VAIEYDAWFWHGHKVQEDYCRALELVNLGWRVLSIKTSKLLPTLDQLQESIAQLDQHPYIELVLDDWGIGRTKEQAFS